MEAIQEQDGTAGTTTEETIQYGESGGTTPIL
jgi:hypothetical protein